MSTRTVRRLGSETGDEILSREKRDEFSSGNICHVVVSGRSLSVAVSEVFTVSDGAVGGGSLIYIYNIF